MNRQYTLIIAFIFSLLFVTASSTYVDVKQIVPLPIIVKKVGANKINVEVSWNGTGEAEDEKGITRLRCYNHEAVTVKNSPQNHVFGERKTTYELTVHKENALVKCRTGFIDIKRFIWTFSFRT